jgi:hypothetical protein
MASTVQLLAKKAPDGTNRNVHAQRIIDYLRESFIAVSSIMITNEEPIQTSSPGEYDWFVEKADVSRLENRTYTLNNSTASVYVPPLPQTNVTQATLRLFYMEGNPFNDTNFLPL